MIQNEATLVEIGSIILIKLTSVTQQANLSLIFDNYNYKSRTKCHRQVKQHVDLYCVEIFFKRAIFWHDFHRHMRTFKISVFLSLAWVQDAQGMFDIAEKCPTKNAGQHILRSTNMPSIQSIVFDTVDCPNRYQLITRHFENGLEFHY